MKRTIRFFVVFLGLLTAIACASDTTHRQAVEDMLKATQVDKMLDAMTAQVDATMEQFYMQMKLPEETRPIYEKYAKQMRDLLHEEVTWEKIENEVAPAYMEVYTEKELKDITAFFTSPLGKKFLEHNPDLATKVYAAAQKNMQRLTPEMQAIADQMNAELKATAEKIAKEQSEKSGGEESAPAEKPAP